MKPEYKAFLECLIAKERRGRAEWNRAAIMRGQCFNFVNAFTEKFPELTAQPGFYSSWDGEEDEEPGCEHWWCVTADGEIVDPTVEQFFYPGRYIPYDESRHHVRLGRCMNCGNDIYGLKARGHQCVCDDEDCITAMEQM